MKQPYIILTALFVTSLVAANAMVGKLFTAFGITLSCGILAYPVTFLVTDLISEVYGEKHAQRLVITGLIMSFYLLALLKLGQYLPVAPGLDRQAEYEAMFGSSIRAIIASMIAYTVAQFLDVKMFHFWKRLTKGKYLWLRNNASTMVSQLIDSSLVVTILFYGVLPAPELTQLIIASWAFKLAIAALDTPLLYLGVRWLRSRTSS